MNKIKKEFSGYVYCIINLINGKYYIGSHKSNAKTPQDCINDKYYGRGKLLMLAYKKYGRSNFTKEILCITDTCRYQEMIILNFLDAKNDTSSYNLKNDATGGNGISGESHPNKKPCARSNMSQIKKNSTYFQSKQFRDAISNACMDKKNPMFGKKHTTEAIHKMKQCKMGELNPSKTQISRNKIKQACLLRTTRKVSVQCVETGEIFESMKDVLIRFGMSRTTLEHAIKNNRTAYGYHWVKYNK